MSQTTLAVARRALAAVEVLADRPPRHALTQEQRTAVEGWPGWGPLAGMFDVNMSKPLAAIAAKLEETIGEDAFEYGSHQCDNAFYTGRPIIEHMWSLLSSAGFTGGKVVDLGCGSGRFAQYCPEDLSIEYHGLEIDPTAARIAELINPHARITNKPLEKVTIEPNSFDVAIGNVPFGSTPVHDSRVSSGSLHGYFLKRAVDAVRPGGFVLLVTSRFHMDSRRGLSSVAGEADFIGAVRLPGKTFSADGTNVVADVVFLQKRDQLTDESPDPVEYPLRYLTTEGVDYQAQVSSYFLSNPQMVAGTMASTGNHHNNLDVKAASPAKAIARSFKHLAKKSPTYVGLDVSADTLLADVFTDSEGRKEGSFHLFEETVYQVREGELVPSKFPKNAELIALVGLRDAVTSLVDAESDWDATDSLLHPLRADALERYLSYVETYGPLNRATATDGPVDPVTGIAQQRWRRPSMAGFRADPSAELVFGIEQYDESTGDSSPAAILLRRTNHRPALVTHVDTAEEAITVSLSRHGCLHVATVAQLLGIDVVDVEATLGDLAFRDPLTGDLVEASEYLSGNIAIRLDQARSAAELDDSFARNVAALETVLPAQLGPEEISVALGVTWLNPEDVSAFLKERMGYRYVSVAHEPQLGVWEVSGHSEGDAAAEAAFGTSRLSIAKIVEAGMNGGVPVVYDFIGPSSARRKVRNASETALAGDRLALINTEFALWLWSDPERSDRILSAYNRRFNSVVPRKANGDYLTFPSMSSDAELWDNQLRGIDRALRNKHQGVYIAHTMGAGKTLTALGTAIKMREFGMASKPCIITPKPVLEQFAREARQTFPTANFLVATKEQVTGPAKRQFVARAATGSWDAVIMSHETFTSLGVDERTEMRYVADELDALRDCAPRGSRGPKALAGRRRSLEKRLNDLKEAAHDDDTLTFDMLGVDVILVDEVHAFRNVPVSTRTPGLSIAGSQRALDLLLKVRGLAAKRPNSTVVVCYSGTPWSNSLTETFVWTNLCAPSLLEDARCSLFDAWAANFVTFETVIETSPDGGALRSNTRPVRIRNAPEARAMFQTFADMLPPSEMKVDRPDVERSLLVAEPNDAQVEHMRHLSKRADEVRNRGRSPQEGDDNMLNVCNDGRLLALDPRLLGVSADSPKLKLAADGIAKHWADNRDVTFPGSDARGVFQLVCMDLGTPDGTGDKRSYGRLRNLLVQRGVPAGKIRFIHEAKNARAREALFAQCREGSVSVLVASSSKAGLGVNIQSRLSALWHIDSPWTPSSKAQREGRAVRPGNGNSTVRITDVVTEGTFDGLVNSAVARKHQMIEQMFTNAPMDREVVDVSADAVSLAEVSAAATGHPELIEQAELAAKVHKLKVSRSSHYAQVRRIEQQATSATYSADRCEATAELINSMRERIPHQARILTREQSKDAGVAMYRNHGIYRHNRLLLKRAGRFVTIGYAGSILDDLAVPLGDERPTTMARWGTWLHGAMREWSESLASREQELRELATDYRCRADDLSSTSRSLTFPEAADLAVLEGRLATLTARIHDATDVTAA